MLCQSQQQQEEHTQRQSHEPILDRMHSAPRHVLLDEQCEKAQADEHAGILDSSLNLLVQVDGPDQVNSERTVLQLPRSSTREEWPRGRKESDCVPATSSVKSKAC
jgi:hypothetical protein